MFFNKKKVKAIIEQDGRRVWAKSFDTLDEASGAARAAGYPIFEQKGIKNWREAIESHGFRVWALVSGRQVALPGFRTGERGIPHNLNHLR